MEKRYTFKRSAGWWWKMLTTEHKEWGRKRNTPLEKIIELASAVLIFGYLGIMMIIHQCTTEEWHSVWGIYLLITIPTVLVSLWPLLKMDDKYIRYIEVRPGRIRIVRRRDTLEWDNICSITPFTKGIDDRQLSYLNWLGRKRNGLSIRYSEYHSDTIGDLTRISNNLDELALVTLADGKKYIINYPCKRLTGRDTAQTANRERVADCQE